MTEVQVQCIRDCKFFFMRSDILTIRQILMDLNWLSDHWFVLAQVIGWKKWWPDNWLRDSGDVTNMTNNCLYWNLTYGRISDQICKNDLQYLMHIKGLKFDDTLELKVSKYFQNFIPQII